MPRVPSSASLDVATRAPHSHTYLAFFSCSGEGIQEAGIRWQHSLRFGGRMPLLLPLLAGGYVKPGGRREGRPTGRLWHILPQFPLTKETET